MAMWEERTALRDKLGNGDGKALHERLMMLGLILTPDTPSFHDARTGYLAADLLLDLFNADPDAGNQCLIWRVFADERLGVTAGPDADTDQTPTVSTATPPECDPEAVIDDTPALATDEGTPLQLDGTGTMPTVTTVTRSRIVGSRRRRRHSTTRRARRPPSRSVDNGSFDCLPAGHEHRRLHQCRHRDGHGRERRTDGDDRPDPAHGGRRERAARGQRDLHRSRLARHVHGLGDPGTTDLADVAAVVVVTTQGRRRTRARSTRPSRTGTTARSPSPSASPTTTATPEPTRSWWRSRTSTHGDDRRLGRTRDRRREDDLRRCR